MDLWWMCRLNLPCGQRFNLLAWASIGNKSQSLGPQEPSCASLFWGYLLFLFVSRSEQAPKMHPGLSCKVKVAPRGEQIQVIRREP